LARASLKAEIADAAWELDRPWSKELLSMAYEITFPDQDIQNTKPGNVVGAKPNPPTPSDRARTAIRNRIIQIASKDKSFVDKLIESGIGHSGPSEGQMAYAELAETSRRLNDLNAAGEYILKSIDIDPSQLAAGFVLADLAKTDRSKADELIIPYLQRLSGFPLSNANNSAFRVFWIVDRLIYPPADIKPPSPNVMRAYVRYIVQSLGNLEQREPGSVRQYRFDLLRAYFPMKEYAPDLAPDFLVLEQKSRPMNSNESAAAGATDILNRLEQYRNKAEEGSEKPNEIQIQRCITNHDFQKARSLIGKLPDSSDRERLGEIVNSKESLFLVSKDRLIEARELAEKLGYASTIQEAYVAIIARSVSMHKDDWAQEVMLQAVKQLKTANKTLWGLPKGMPTTVALTSRDIDPVLNGIARLTVAISSVSVELAMIGLSETVAAANVSEVDTSQGRSGFDIRIFKQLSEKDEERVRLAADSFKDPFRRLLSLAAVDQWKAADLVQRQKSLRPNTKIRSSQNLR
jgi:hypothetical protein